MSKNGLINSKSYQTWASMKQRCNNPNNKHYKDYGGRGIGICKEWVQFINFYKDMGEPLDSMSLDRIDNNKGYFKDNCRWATNIIQGRNQRTRKDNRTGVRGVYFRNDTKKNKWREKITVNGKEISLGSYKTLEEAKEIRKKSELKYWT